MKKSIIVGVLLLMTAFVFAQSKTSKSGERISTGSVAVTPKKTSVVKKIAPKVQEVKYEPVRKPSYYISENIKFHPTLEKKYTLEQFKGLPIEEQQKLTNYYFNSWEYTSTGKCPNRLKQYVNIEDFEALRKNNKRVVVETEDKCETIIELKSKKELDYEL